MGKTLRGGFHGTTNEIARRWAMRSRERPERQNVPGHDASCELSHREGKTKPKHKDQGGKKRVSQSDLHIQKRNTETMRLSDLVVAVAGLLFTTNPTLATFLAASPGSTVDSNMQLLNGAVTMDSGYMATEIVLAGERTSTGWVRACMWLGPVRVMSFSVGLEIEGPSERFKWTRISASSTMNKRVTQY